MAFSQYISSEDSPSDPKEAFRLGMMMGGAAVAVCGLIAISPAMPWWQDNGDD